MKNVIKIWLAVLMAWIVTTANAQQPKTALELNDRLAAITDSLYAKGQLWGTQFVSASKSKDFTTLKPYRENIQRFITSELKAVKTMKDINGSEKLREAIIEFLNYENKMVVEGFLPVEKLGKTATEDDVQKVIKDLTAKSEDEAYYLKKVSLEQEAYAKKNGFTIEAGSLKS